MRLGRLLLLAAGLAAGCSSAQEPHGPPVLLNVYWIVNGQATPIWATSSTDVIQAPPGAQEIDFVFDRVLDGDRIEDTVTQNGIPTTVPKATPPITVSWPDEATAMSAPPFADTVRYNSVPLYGGTTSYVLLQPTALGFPSSDTVTFALDKTGLTSFYDEPMIGPGSISVETGPFSASFQLPADGDASTAVPQNYMLPVTFTNRIAVATVEPYIHLSAGGRDVPFQIVGGTSDGLTIYLSAASCLGGWPTGAPIAATVAAGAPDAFGVPMPAEATTTFMAVGSTSPPDGGCGVSDGGVD
jgi:hypothetical protein